VAFGQSEPLERADVAAAEDGRTPLNTYDADWSDPSSVASLLAKRGPASCARRRRGDTAVILRRVDRDGRAPLFQLHRSVWVELSLRQFARHRLQLTR
jgi:hypothetical protein